MVILYSKNNCRAQKYVRNVAAARKFLRSVRPERWALYHERYQGRRFSNSTDTNFLIAHDDDYFHNIGFTPATNFTI